jgi:starvation-inducible DNA-binding protein
LEHLFDTYAGAVAKTNDTLAERAVTLGGIALGTVRHAAKGSKLPEYPRETKRDLEHVKLLAERLDGYLAGLRESRSLTEQLGDTDTNDVLTGMIINFDKHAWFLRSTLDGGPITPSSDGPRQETRP